MTLMESRIFKSVGKFQNEHFRPSTLNVARVKTNFQQLKMTRVQCEALVSLSRYISFFCN